MQMATLVPTASRDPVLAGNANCASSYRSDINGLRALALVAVVLYHFHVPGFSGGFVGVDIFFVISGFLMTGIVVKGLEQGNFSLSSFYLARARRILPALAALSAVLIGLGWFILLPPDYKTLGTHTVYSLAFLSNIEYWLEAGYFDVASHDKWLLHTWSLSVEWQFYLVLPLLLMLVWHFRPGRLAQKWTVAIGLAMSLIASIVTTKAEPTAAFFLLPTRAWEMLGGSLTFLWASTQTLSLRKRGYLEGFGLAILLAAIAFVDGNSDWPGWRALLPVAATVMVLLAERKSSWTGNPVAHWLGERSYSLYLWHWPIYVALVYIKLNNETGAILGGLLVTVVLGHLSYIWIERPSRKLLARMNVNLSRGMLVAIMASVALPAIAIWFQKGVSGRFHPDVEAVAAEALNTNPRREACHPNKGLIFPSCVYGGTTWKVIALGDSHVNALISGIEQGQSMGDAGVVQWTYSGCQYVPGMKKTPLAQAAEGGVQYKCAEFIALAESRLNTIPSSIPVVIIGRYAASAFGGGEEQQGANKPSVYFSKIYQTPHTVFLNEFAAHITNSACELAKHRKVYMVRPIPEMGTDVPKTLARRMNFGIPGDLSISMNSYRMRNDWVWTAQNEARNRCGIKILDPLPYLCKDEKCYGSKDGHPLYHDDNHLSEFGNKLLAPMFAAVFQEM